jgi:hypothetical protein
MAARGDFSPIERGEVVMDRFASDEGKIIFNTIVNYHTTTGGAVRWPSLSVLKNKFKSVGFDFPAPDPGDTVDGLAYEFLAECSRREMNVVAADLVRIAALPEFGDELTGRVATLRNILDRSQKSKRASLHGNMAELIDKYETGTIQNQGIRWPWPLLQEATQGQHRKETTWVVGRPKNKKTFVGLSIAAHNALVENEPGIIFTPEMSAEITLLRVVAFGAKSRYTELKRGLLSDEEHGRLIDLAKSLGAFDTPESKTASFKTKHAELHVLESAGRSLSWCQSQIALLKPRWVMFDSFYLQEADTPQKDEAAKLRWLTRGAKRLVMEMGLSGLFTHQLNRNAADKLAGLEDIAFSDSVGQDADLILSATSGNLDGPKTALRVIGAREIELEGFMINSRVCSDFSEVGLIPNMSVVKKLMNVQEKAKNENRAKQMLERAGSKRTT